MELNTENFNLETAIHELSEFRQKDRTASVYSLIVYWPLVSSLIILGVGEIIALGVNRGDPLALFHIKMDFSLLLGLLIMLCTLGVPLLKSKLKEELHLGTGANPPDCLDPFSDQKQYISVLDECIRSLQKLQNEEAEQHRMAV
jgi:hypothetical protein